MARLIVTVEVPLLLVFFGLFLQASVYTNLIIYRTCYLTLGYNQSECALLGNTDNNITEHLEKLVEPRAAVINMVKSMPESLLTSLLCLFIGTWSDRFGRKPVLLLTQIGFMASYILIAAYSYIPNISPWYSVGFSMPTVLTGGMASFLTAVLAYITDITSEETRGFRIAIFEATIAMGVLLGNISSSYVFYATGYTAVFAIAAGCCILGIIFTIFFIPESLQNRETQGMLRGFFQTSNVVEMVKTTVQRREKYNRTIVLLCVGTLAFYIFTINGDSLMFLYLRKKLEWTLKKYTLFSSIDSLIWILGTMGGTYLLHKLLHVKESVLVLMGLLSMLNGVLLQGLATRDWHIYAAAGVKSVGGLISPMVRSLVSKLVPADDVGKIFSLIMAAEFILGIGASPLYTAVYNSTINTNPGIFNFMSAGFHTMTIILIITVIILENASLRNNYEPVTNERDAGEGDHLVT